MNAESTPGYVQTIEQYGQLLAAADTAGILALYADEAEIIPDGLPSVRGTDDIRRFYEATFAAIRIDGALRIFSSAELGDSAIVRCEEPAFVVSQEDGTRRGSYFRELFVLVPRDGEWRILKYMFSENSAQADA